MSLLKDTSVPSSCAAYFSLLTGSTNQKGYKAYDAEDARGWLSGHADTGRGLDAMVNSAKSVMERFMGGAHTPTDLVNGPNLELLDFPSKQLIELTRRATDGQPTTASQRNEVACLALYINTQGLIHGSDTMCVIQEGFGQTVATRHTPSNSSTNNNNNEDGPKLTLETFEAAHDSDTIARIVENITATQLQDLLAEAVAAQPEDKGVGRIHNSTAEELEDRLVLLLKEPAVNLTY
jgi:hypothetical protein